MLHFAHCNNSYIFVNSVYCEVTTETAPGITGVCVLSKQSVPHSRTRNDHSTETAEDYVEAIADILADQGTCRVRDLATFFGVSHVTVSRIVKRLQQHGLLHTRPYYPIELTLKGRQLASASKHRHQIVFDFLLSLGLDERTAALDSEGIEHHISQKTLKVMQSFTHHSPGTGPS